MDLKWLMIASIVNLDKPGHYISWGWLQISLANLIVIVLMVVTFVAALFLPFPGRNKRRGGDR